MTMFQINPPRQALVDKNGFITAEWYRFFVEMRKVTQDTSGSVEDGDIAFSIPPQTGYLAGGVEGALTPPVQPVEPDLALIPPTVANAPDDPLTPPQIVVPQDDFLYPPRYGA